MHTDPEHTTAHPSAEAADRPPSPESPLSHSSANIPHAGERTDSSGLGVPAHAGTTTGEKPASLGRYKILSLLGRGGFGTVYLGHDTQLDRPVAVKVPHRALDPTQTEKFLREARRLAKLRHPGIVIVHDVGVESGRCYIVSDFIRGQTLRDWMQSRKTTWQEAVRIVAAVADALAHAHAQSTVHRDVKPSNITLSEDLTPVLLDFGLALTEEEVAAPDGQIAGTVAYMSPEQASGAGHRLDGRTDIFSLGVILYELLCGRRPFRAEESTELLRQVREDEPQPPRQLMPGLPRELERICLKALAKSIAARYTTAGDFAEELRRVLAHPDAVSPPPPAAHQSTPTTSGSSVLPASESRDRPARGPERRQITVLACNYDLNESAENLEDEEQLARLTACERACTDAVRRHGGAIVQSGNGSLLVCFGYPQAFEDAAHRAIHAGLGILENLAGLAARLPPVRVAIHSGLAVVEDLGGEKGPAVVGEARNVAVALGSLAPEKSVWISEATHGLVRGFFVCEGVGCHAIKGLARPLGVYRVLRRGDASSRIEVAGTAGLTPLIGRAQEVGLLLGRWEQARDGLGQVVLLSGEAGIGKSRLLHEVKEQVRQQSGADRGAVVEWRCAPFHENSALYPATDGFERLLSLRREDSPAHKLDKLVDHLRLHKMDQPETVALFAALLSLPLEGRYPALALTPQRQKDKTLEALLEWLRRLAARQPVLFIVEDLHWVDASTLDLLTLLVEQGQADRQLTVLTARPEFVAPWGGKASQNQIALNRLSRRQIADLMQRKTGARHLPPALVEQVAARTDGVPLFVEEFTKMVQESGALREVDGNVELSQSFPVQAIPATLQDLLMARLDRMASVREVTQLASALGREFSYELLHAVCPLDEPALQGELAKLVEAELLYPKGRPPRCSYLFKHALIQDAAYQSLVKSRRQQFHRTIARALEERFPETREEKPELLAHHCSEADLPAQAIGWWEAAGRRAQERWANAEAIGHFRRGLALVAGLAATPERDQQELRMLIPLAVVLMTAQGYASPDLDAVHERARTLCEKIGPSAPLFHVLWGIWACRLLRDQLDITLRLADELLLLAEERGDRGLLMEANFSVAITRFYRGDFLGSRAACERCSALQDAEQCRLHARYTGQYASTAFRCYRALSSWHLGYPDLALQEIEDAVAHARSLDHPFSLAYALHHAGWVCYQCRLGERGQQFGEEVIALSAEQGFAFWAALGAISRGSGLLVQGRLEEALGDITRGVAAFRATGSNMSLSHYHGYFAEIHWKAGRPREAQQELDETFASVERSNNRFYEAELHRLQGEVLRAGTGAPEAVEACFNRSLDVARRQQAKSWELRSAMSLCRLRSDQGRAEEGRRQLAEVYEWFTEGFDTADLVDARALLAK